jgi:hypothetical protein
MIHGLLCANQLTTMGIEATSRNSAFAAIRLADLLGLHCIR